MNSRIGTKLRISALAAFCFTTFPAICADVKIPLLRVGTDFYTNVTVLNKTPTDVYFKHSRGMANAKLKELPPELQKQLGYDAIIAGSTEKQQAEANAGYRKQLAAKPSAKSPKPAAAQGKKSDPPEIRVPKLSARSIYGQPAPALAVERWLTPQPNLAGKFLLIDFWATWCPPCRKSIPDLNALHAKFKDQMVIVGLSDESETDIRAMRSPRIDYWVASDTEGRMKRGIEVRGIPHALLIDPNGIVRFEGHPGYLTEKGVANILAKYGN